MPHSPSPRGGIWTPANVVTCVRILFIPVFMVLCDLSFRGHAEDPSVPLAFAAFALYMLLSLTDKVDGYLARSRGEVTDFGKFLDPIADKLLVFSALLLLMDMGYVNLWFVFVILVREFLVSALRMVASAAGVVIAADRLGKAKTAVTMVAIWCQMPLALAITPSRITTPTIWRSARCGKSTGPPSASSMRIPHRRLPGVWPGQTRSGMAM